MSNDSFLLRHVHLATFAPEQADYGLLPDAALWVQDGHIAWLGAEQDLPAGLPDCPEQDGQGAWLTPGLIDCHTHLVYGGNRAHEFELRLQGASYEEIARAGGGIRSTVQHTRAADEATLLQSALRRLDDLLAEGVTTVEIKSGYGLSRDDETRMLRVAGQLAQARAVTVQRTCLAAHALPPEFAGDADGYIDAICQWLPQWHAEGLVDAVDAFCENIGFSPAQTERLFQCAQQLGLPVKLHAEQLSDQGGAALVARYHGLSADHLEWLSPQGIQAMAQQGTVAVLLPGAFYYLRETRLPPIDALRAAGVPMAVATDCNPGTSPMTSLLLALNMACTLFRLTPAEALAGATREAARALGLLHDRGTLEVGKRADLALWAIHHPRELVYTLGARPLLQRWVAGQAS
ncbi:imidazolonepropionase [Leeia sp.]|uniref:imidazolonepropionase n=1 Tax=Leeia sp. TaxID=2884678 RepID=UPI0035B47A4E